MLTFEAVLPKFAALTVQWLAVGCAFVNAGKLSGLHVCVSVTEPCLRMNATGIVTVLPQLRGTRLMRPWYWPVATSGALISIGNVVEPSLATCRGRPSLTVIVTPAGAVVLTSSVWFLPETFFAVRCVVRSPVNVVA